MVGCSKTSSKLSSDFYIETIESNNCSEQLTNYYNNNSQTIFLYCLDRVNLYDDNSSILLKDYILQKGISIDETMREITSKLVNVESLWDGGTKIYQDKGKKKYTNNGISVIICNTVDGNKDVYIGPQEMEYNEKFCK